MNGYTFWGVLGIVLPIAISVYAALIAMQSNKKMAQLSAYQIEEKIAMMATHHHNLAAHLYSLEAIGQFRNDLKALSHLQKFITLEQKNDLKLFLNPILNMLDSGKKGFADSKWEEIYDDINKILKCFY